MVDNKLYSLLKVYETGNFTRAAEQLSLTQPAVSQHIRSLEKELNVHIFERSSGKMVVTPEGDMVIKCAKRIVALYHNLERDLSSEKRQITSLTVGITHTAESSAIAESLARYVNTHEGVNIKLRTDSPAALYDLLRNYELDFAIIEGRMSDPGLRHQLLDTDNIVLAVSPEHRLSGKTSVTIEELKKEKMLLRLPDSGTRNLFMASLEAQNMSIEEFNIVLEVNNIATIKDLIRRNFGVSVLAKSACMDEMRKHKIVLLPIENLSMMREINIVSAPDFEHPQVISDIVSCYREVQAMSAPASDIDEQN